MTLNPETQKKNRCVKTRQQLADEYNVHRNTFTRRLKKVGIDLPDGLVYPEEQERIYEKLGRPEG